MNVWRSIPANLVAQLLRVLQLRDGRDALELLDRLVELQVLAQAIVGAVFVVSAALAALLGCGNGLDLLPAHASRLIVQPCEVVIVATHTLRLLGHARHLHLSLLLGAALRIRDALDLGAHSPAHSYLGIVLRLIAHGLAFLFSFVESLLLEHGQASRPRRRVVPQD